MNHPCGKVTCERADCDTCSERESRPVTDADVAFDVTLRCQTSWHHGFHVRRRAGYVDLLERRPYSPFPRVVLSLPAKVALEVGDMLRLAAWNEISEKGKE